MFPREEERGSKRFKTHERKFLTENDALKFNGQHAEYIQGCVRLHQHPYVDRMPDSAIARTPDSFASYRGAAAYVTSCTRPDAACAVNQLAQTPGPHASETDFSHRRLHLMPPRRTSSDWTRRQEVESNQIRARLRQRGLVHGRGPRIRRRIFRHEQGPILTIGMCGRSRGRRLGVIDHRMVLSQEQKGDAVGVGHRTLRSSARVRRRVRSGTRFNVLLSRKMHIRVFTDSRTLFDSIVTLRSMTEKRLLVDIAGLRVPEG